MKQSRKMISCLLVTLIAFTQPVFAWNDLGHMAVAYVAYQSLTAGTKTHISALLKRNPFYKKWEAMIPAGTPKAKKELMLFMIAATWPDQIKRAAGYQDNGAPGSNGNRPDGVQSSQNLGYSDHLRHKYWHFVDQPFSRDGTAGPVIPAPNAETQIAAFRAVLSNPAADEGLKSYDLVWLLHLIGDVHQPLHAATRVSHAAPDGDNGGNAESVCVASATSCGTKLHSFWDGALGAGNVSDAIRAAQSLNSVSGTLANDLSTSNWIKESLDEAETVVYVPPIKAGNGPFQLTSAYKVAARNLAKERVAVAGARLGNILNQEMK